MTNRSTCIGATVTRGAWALCCRRRRACSIVREDFDQARAQASEAMTLCQELEDPRGIAWSLDVFAGLLAAGGHADAAARLWGASDGLLESVGGSCPGNRMDQRAVLRAREAIARR